MTLIGMPGVGKSTIAAALRDLQGFDVVELDKVIEHNEGQTLPEILASRTEAEFKKVEAAAVRSIPLAADQARMPRVISTGGSVVYYPDAMAHLRSVGPELNLVVHLELDYETLYERTEGFSNRGVVFNGKTCEAMFSERAALYEQYRHVSVDCRGQTVHETAAEVLRLLRETHAAAAERMAPSAFRRLRRAATSTCRPAHAAELNAMLPARQLSEPILVA